MTAFDRAWLVVKNWTPDWRNQAALLDDLERDELPKPLNSGTWENEILPGYINEGTKVGVFEHPHHQDFVIKVPFQGEHGESYNEEQFETRNERDSIVEILERLGYPLMGELQNPEGYSIQPRLDSAQGGYYPEKNIADVALMHLVNDRHNQNYGIDDTMGKIRNFDIDSMGWSDDWWPTESEKGIWGEQTRQPAQKYQNMLDKEGIQHPASKLLNIIPEVDRSEREDPNYRLQSFRTVMEALEPYSDNPNTLTVDGKPIWLEEGLE